MLSCSCWNHWISSSSRVIGDGTADDNEGVGVTDLVAGVMLRAGRLVVLMESSTAGVTVMIGACLARPRYTTNTRMAKAMRRIGITVAITIVLVWGGVSGGGSSGSSSGVHLFVDLGIDVRSALFQIIAIAGAQIPVITEMVDSSTVTGTKTGDLVQLRKPFETIEKPLTRSAGMTAVSSLRGRGNT